MSNRAPALDTLTVWAGEDGNAESEHLGTQVPIVQSVAFGYKDIRHWEEVAQGKKPGHIYSRNTNPTVAAFEDKVRQLEGAETAISFASGMAAISNSLFALLSPGDRVVSVDDTYGGTRKLFLEFLPRFQIDVQLCATDDPAAIEAAIADGCNLLYLETPTNPTLKILDLHRLLKVGRDAGAVTVVDNTFATPINQNPLKVGADLVIHSATKFLGGHADALGGAVCGTLGLTDQIYHYREITGAALDPMAAYLLLRGMKTLHLRIERQNSSALTIARFLQGHPHVSAVHYPGLESHPEHAIARKQMRGFGGILSFELRDGVKAMRRMLPRLRYAHLAANLGSVETVAGPPSTTSHVELSAEERAAAGIREGLIRYSVGIESPEDLIADLEQALG